MDPQIKVLREFDPETSKYLRLALFGDRVEKIAKWEQVVKDPVFKPKFIESLDTMRGVAYARIKRICDEKLVSIFDFENDPKNIFTAHE